jgi:hypothetical protein
MPRHRPAPVSIEDVFARILQEITEGIREEWIFTQRENPPVESVIPDAMFRKLIMLCHPDKHENSKTSQEVTRWLLGQRTK